MTDPFTPHSLRLTPEPAPIATATNEVMLAILQGAALRDIIRERQDQVERHGFTPEHDANHAECELTRGALAYLTLGLVAEVDENPSAAFSEASTIWPWGDLFHPTDYRGCLIKALAMLWAEVDRIDAAQQLIDAVKMAPFKQEPQRCDYEIGDDGVMTATADWQRNDYATHLRLIGCHSIEVPVETIAGWTDDQVKAADIWAWSCALSASDHDDMQVPPRPDFLPNARPHGGIIPAEAV